MDQNLTKTELLDKFDDCNFALIFMESALRSMAETGNISEARIEEGLSTILFWLIGEYKEVQAQVKDGFEGE